MGVDSKDKEGLHIERKIGEIEKRRYMKKQR